MGFKKEIVEYLDNHQFSIEMLDYCRWYFQVSAFDEKEEAIFRKIMINKVQEFFPDLTPNIGNIFAQLCLDAGCLKIKDIVFVDGAIFVVREDIINPRSFSYIYYIGNIGNFKLSGANEFVDAFTASNVNDKKSKMMARELHNIFKQYYHWEYFPESLNWAELVDGCYCIDFAINCDEKEIIDALIENKSINFTIISQIRQTSELCALELSLSPKKNSLLEVVGCKDDNIVRLSDIIEKGIDVRQKKLNKEKR